MRRLPVGAAGLLCLALLTTAPPPTANAQVPLADWLSRSAVPVEGIHRAENDAFGVLQAEGPIDADQLQADCTGLHDANEGLRNGMPTPDPRLTVEVQQAIDNFDTAAQSCIEAVATHSMTKLDDFVSALKTAERHLSRADTILVALAAPG
ncbi:hypothetical protein A5696_02310 [Mycobacterium sp. E2699]|nr:hypothetical protein A5696_02310 [Mycobacterium sp. E2699]OBI56648.1 hypothetical protein A5705_20680 [Mycobacterium sp. E787]